MTRERKSLDDLMTQKRIGAYVGIDPTAPSMHVGHLVPFMSLFWLHVNGFRTVSLVSAVSCGFTTESLTRHSLAEQLPR